MLNFPGTCNTWLVRCFADLSNSIVQFPKFLKCYLVKPKQLCSRYVIVEQARQKNLNEKPTVVLFRNVFNECSEGQSAMCSFLAAIGWFRILSTLLILFFGNVSSASSNLSIIEIFTNVSTFWGRAPLVKILGKALVSCLLIIHYLQQIQCSWTQQWVTSSFRCYTERRQTFEVTITYRKMCSLQVVDSRTFHTLQGIASLDFIVRWHRNVRRQSKYSRTYCEHLITRSRSTVVYERNRSPASLDSALLDISTFK